MINNKLSLTSIVLLAAASCTNPPETKQLPIPQPDLTIPNIVTYDGNAYGIVLFGQCLNRTQVDQASLTLYDDLENPHQPIITGRHDHTVLRFGPQEIHWDIGNDPAIQHGKEYTLVYALSNDSGIGTSEHTFTAIDNSKQ